MARRGTFAALLLLGTALASVAVAQDKPKSEKPAEKPPEVTVTGKRRDVVDKIDRRTYDIRNDPNARTGVLGDVLKKLPSVSIDPDGNVQLRGDSNVTILIDGKPAPQGSDPVHNLASSGVDKIEIITNPSAQYSPDGTGGIINIITNKKHVSGLSGNANLELDSRGAVRGTTAVSVTKGPWTFGGNAAMDSSSRRYHGGQITRTLNTAGGYDELDQDSTGRSTGRYGGGGLTAAYKLSDKASLNFELNGGDGRNQNSSRTAYHSASGDFAEASAEQGNGDNTTVTARYSYTNDAKNEKLTLNANLDRFTFDNSRTSVITPTGGAVSSYRYDRFFLFRGGGMSGDYERNFGKHILTVGMSWNSDSQRQTTGYTNLGGTMGPQAFDSSHRFDGTRNLAAVYVTWQSPLGQVWTLLPGLRVEAQDTGLPQSAGSLHIRDVGVYPSLHLNRDMGPKAHLKLSYSRRIQRPGPSMYDPAIQYSGAKNGYSGNPAIKPVGTDAYEASYDFADHGFSYDVTVYYRVNNGDWSEFTRQLPNDVLVATTVNAGHSASGGAEFTLRGPLSPHWKYALDADLFYKESTYVDTATTTRRRGLFSTVGNGNIEWDGDKRGPLDGDQFQVTLTYRGKSQTLQGYYAGNYSVDLSYRRALTPKVSVVVTTNDIFNSNVWKTVIDTPQLKVTPIVHPRSQGVRIALAYKLGS